MTNLMFTQNTDKLRQEVTAHVAADTIAQGTYWDRKNNKGCFIGCLAKAADPKINEVTYGLPVMVQRIAESIFEALGAGDAKAFFAALPDAVYCDGKDLTKVGWQFLAAELRSLPCCTAQVQAVIDPVIIVMDLLASGQEWTADAASDAAWAATYAARAAAADWADAHAARAAAWAAAADADAWAAAAGAALAAAAAADWADAHAARVAAYAAHAAWAAAEANAWAARAVARLRQRDLLLRLISEAPVVEAHH